MIRDVPSISTYPWRASIQSGSLEKFSLNQTNEIKSQTKQNQVTSSHGETVKGVCIKRITTT